MRHSPAAPRLLRSPASTRDVNTRLVKDEIEAAVGTIRSALKEWRHEAGAESARERGWRWRQEMRRATTDSAVAAELVARNVCLASGVAPAGGHHVAKMGQNPKAPDTRRRECSWKGSTGSARPSG